MADDLDDGEFWLPSHFLTDDDILMDFGFSTTANGGGGGGGSGGGSSSYVSDLDFASVVESDEDDLLNVHHLSLHQSSCPLHFKGCGAGSGGVLSSSPQSTLCRCVCNQSSSRESASPPPPQADEKINTAAVNATGVDENSTLNLLNKAAGEVARLKLMTENNNNNNNNKKIGTGFFDCSQKRVSYPPPPVYFQPQFLHFPPMVWPPVQYKYNQAPKQQHQQNKASKNENKNNATNDKNNNRPLGLPLSAWPPLQAQAQSQAQPQVQSQAQPKQLPPLFVGPPKGTGVFLPRQVTTPANENRKKSDGNATKSKTGKGSQPQSGNRRNSGKTTTTTTTMMTTNHNEIQLPQEWIY